MEIVYKIIYHPFFIPIEVVLSAWLFIKLFGRTLITEYTKKAVEKQFAASITLAEEGTKSFVQLDHHIKLSLYNERKVTVLKMYEAFQTWVQMTDMHFMNSLAYEKEKIMDILNEADKAYYKLIIAESKMDLYVNNEDLSLFLMELKSDVNDILTIIQPYFFDMRTKKMQIEELLPETFIPDASERAERMQKAQIIQNEMEKLYLDIFNNKYKPQKITLHNKTKKLRQKCYDIISKIQME